MTTMQAECSLTFVCQFLQLLGLRGWNLFGLLGILVSLCTLIYCYAWENRTPQNQVYTFIQLSFRHFFIKRISHFCYSSSLPNLYSWSYWHKQDVSQVELTNFSTCNISSGLQQHQIRQQCTPFSFKNIGIERILKKNSLQAFVEDNFCIT